MATSVTNHIIVVKEEGLEKVLADIRSVDASLKSTTRSSRKANDAMHDMYNTQAKGVIGTGSAGQNFAKLSRTINGGGNSLVGAYATLAANIFSITAAFQALKEAAQFQQLTVGLELMGNRLGITLSVAAQKVRELSGGLLSTEQAMRSTAQVISAGFGTTELERITKVAKDASFALGRDMSESMDRLTRGVIKLEPELIDELGIMTRLDEANKVYAKTLNKTSSQLTLTEKRQAFLNAAMAEGELKFGGLSEAAGNLTSIQQLAATFQDLTKAVLSVVNVVAIPLAKFFSASPGSLLGGMILFASTISKDLLPGLYALEKQTLKLAEAKQEALTAEIANFNYSGKNNQGIIKLQETMKAGKATSRDYQIAIANLNSEIEQLNSQKTPARNATGQFANKKSLIEEKAYIIAGLEDILVKENEAAVASASSQAIVAASSRDLKTAYAQLTVAMGLNMTAARANGASLKSLRGIMLLFEVGVKNLTLSLKVAGAAFLNLIPVIGTIILVASMAYDGIKALYTAFVGKEVIEARKNLKEITEQIAEKTKEYNRIRAEAGNLATKEVMASKIISSSLQEQVAALEKLEEAERKRKLTSESRTKGLTAEQNKINTAINEASANSIFGLSNPARTLAEQIKEGTPEVKEEIKKLTGNFENLKEVLRSPELSADILKRAAANLKEMGPATEAAVTSFKELEDAYSAFVKSATPTTPYDKLVQELNKTSDTLVDNAQLMSKGQLTAEQFGNTIGALGSITLGNTSNEVKQLVAEIKKLEEAELTLKTLRETGKTGTPEYNAALKQQEAAQTNITASAGKASALLVRDIIRQKEKATQIQSQSLLMSGQLAMAQAQLSTVSSYNDLSGKGTQDRLKAENNVKSIQAQQILLQVEMLRISIQGLETDRRQLENDEKKIKTRLELLKISSDALDLEQAIVKLSDQNLSKEAKAALNEYIDKKQEQLNIDLQIRNANAGIASAQMQAAAATANMNSKAYIAAAGAATLAKTQDQIAKNTLALTEQQIAIDADKLDIARMELGVAKSTFDEFDALYEKQQKSRNDTIAAIERESEARIKALNADKINALAKGGGEENRRLYDALIQQEIDRRNLQLEALDISSRKALLEILGVKTAVDLEQEKLDILNQQLNVTQSIQDSYATIDANQREIAKINRELQGGPISKVQTLQEEKEVIEAQYSTAVQVATIKYAIIEAEYALLAAQLTKQRDDLQQLDDRRAQLGLPRESEAGINALNDILADLPTAMRAAGDVVASETAKLEAQLKKADTVKSLSGGKISLSNVYNSKFDEATNLERFKNNPIENLQAVLIDVDAQVSTFTAKLSELGPDGEAVSAFAQGSLVIADAALNISKSFEGLKGKTGTDLLSGIASIAESASAGIAAVNSIYQASAKAKIASIDQEIAAEQKRDGKSAESVAKLAALEKKKDSMARKAFEMNKKLMIAQAIMSTAAGVAGALASASYLTPMGAAIMAGVIGAMGAAQVALISGMQYQSTATAAQVATPSTVSIGKRGSSVDLARNNMSVGGELGYLTGATGYGSNPSNFTRRAYGGPARAGMVVGEKGPELFVPSVPGNVVSNDNMPSTPSVNANITIQAIDAEGVEQVLTNNRGHIIGMLREAANSSGQSFLEGVNTQKYRRGGARL